jgi:hypothetical protein
VCVWFTSVPSLDEHLLTSRANEALAEHLAEMHEYGWSITCLFYSLLHLVEAYLQNQDKASANHGERNHLIRQDEAIGGIHRRYVLLKHESENARYECRRFNAGESTYLRDSIYHPVATHMRTLLGVN